MAPFTEITLRDYLAGQALAGLLASFDGDQSLPTESVAARLAYDYADALLAARELEPNLEGVMCDDRR